ncbi:DUF421 domain-containing protein [Allopontixanthobacter sediminis]|uniref:DUF421 domain-containing protein n=1 Tax=Allopontixanthobacter sediminis TaxID=1689985 RepID=A0A845B5I6_9SPHN|nr:YetF domain-containing protein [Allopontixanthobacter sediminis]MXP42909.1 DUF421 domain-containing protein [Allopontixanthobacter sediminis]
MFVDDQIIDLGLRAFCLAAAAMVWIVLLVRINGLRSFSKMTNFDFVMTVAIGSLLAGASQSTEWTAFLQTLLAMATLFFVQWLTARLRKASDTFEEVAQNSPVLLMRDGEFLYDALDSSRVAKSDLIAKLREANVLSFDQVRAAVLETTGDMSILHGSHLDEALLSGVRKPASG